jgi:NADP-dependent 3-hydroxy acid dehydrogenase YdfG
LGLHLALSGSLKQESLVAENRVAVVTGAGSGIGRAIAHRFAEGGLSLVLAGRRPEPLAATAEGVTAAGASVEVIPTDVTDRTSVSALMKAALGVTGEVHILVNNAGINTRQRNLHDIPEEQWDQVLSINLTGAFNCFRALIPIFENQQDGLVINVASMAGKRAGVVGGAAYSASKFGMASFNMSINAEFREKGIRACCIFPGEVDTDILGLRPNPVSDEKRSAALKGEDIAALAWTVASMPDRAIVEEITVFPRRQVS